MTKLTVGNRGSVENKSKKQAKLSENNVGQPVLLEIGGA
jgi:hypothetical protein